MVHFVYNDGGRAEAGYKGHVSDCVVRSITIITGKPYREVYDAINEHAKKEKRTKKSSARNGVYKSTYDTYLKSLGYKWTPTMFIGQGCKVHLKAEELPRGRLIVKTSKHLTAVIDGVIHDTYDPSRDGTRCVYGYYQEKTPDPMLPYRALVDIENNLGVWANRAISESLKRDAGKLYDAIRRDDKAIIRKIWLKHFKSAHQNDGISGGPKPAKAHDAVKATIGRYAQLALSKLK